MNDKLRKSHCSKFHHYNSHHTTDTHLMTALFGSPPLLPPLLGGSWWSSLPPCSAGQQELVEDLNPAVPGLPQSVLWHFCNSLLKKAYYHNFIITRPTGIMLTCKTH